MHDVCALAENQQAQWFLHKLGRGATAYNTGIAIRISGPLDVPALAQATEDIGSRHAMLRSIFTEREGRPVRVVLPRGLPRLDQRRHPELADGGLRTVVGDCLREPFALVETGAFRAVLHTRPAGDPVLLIAGHHIATDAASDCLLVADLLRRYEQVIAGAAPPERLPDSYRDYVREEQELLAGPQASALREHWQDVCRGSAPATLPTDRPRLPGVPFAGGTRRLLIPAGLDDQLRRISLELGVTPFAFLIAVLQAVLFRYTRQGDFLVGCPVTTRLRPRYREVVGNFVNTVVFRARISAATTFGDAALDASAQVRRGMAAARYPFARLASSLAEGRMAGQAALYQVALNMLTTAHLPGALRPAFDTTAEDHGVRYAGLRLSPFRLSQQEGQADLSVAVLRGAAGIAIDLRYDARLYDRTTIEQFGWHFARALELALGQPDTRISRAKIWDLGPPAAASAATACC